MSLKNTTYKDFFLKFIDFLDDYVGGLDLDDAVDNAANCETDFCYKITNPF